MKAKIYSTKHGLQIVASGGKPGVLRVDAHQEENGHIVTEPYVEYDGPDKRPPQIAVSVAPVDLANYDGEPIEFKSFLV